MTRQDYILLITSFLKDMGIDPGVTNLNQITPILDLHGRHSLPILAPTLSSPKTGGEAAQTRQFIQSELTSLQQRYTQIKALRLQSDKVQGATVFHGLSEIYKHYAPALLQAAIVLKRTQDFVTVSAGPSGVRAGNALAYLETAQFTPPGHWTALAHACLRKIQSAKHRWSYTKLFSGKKFEMAGLRPLKPLKSVRTSPAPSAYLRIAKNEANPMERLSKANIERLKTSLRSSGGQGHLGLRPEEHELYYALMTLPLRLQHATNNYYQIANAGRLDSLAELKRRQPGFESAFSTDGNVTKLGNDGFVFFRTYVEGTNGQATRYGDTKLVFDFSLVEQLNGWISLHDQLIPLSSANAKRLYVPNAQNKEHLLLRVADIDESGPGAKNLSSTIIYKYRTHRFSYYQGAKETQSRFHTATPKPVEVKRNFTDEIFYGPACRQGIALSLIEQLRHLEASGYYKHALGHFNNLKTPESRHNYLGQLLKGFFRVETKIPVAINLRETPPLKVINPEGDRRFDINLNPRKEEMKIGLLKDSRVPLETELHAKRQLLGRHNKIKIEKKTSQYDESIATLTGEIAQLSEQLDRAKQAMTEHATLVEGKINKITSFMRRISYGIFVNRFKKMTLQELDQWTSFILPELSQNYLYQYLENDHTTIDFLNQDTDDIVSFLKIVSEGDLNDLMDDGVITLEMALEHEDALPFLQDHDLHCALLERDLKSLFAAARDGDEWLIRIYCADSLSEFLLQNWDDMPSSYMEHFDDEDIQFVMENACESEGLNFQIYLDNISNSNYRSSDAEDPYGYDFGDYEEYEEYNHPPYDEDDDNDASQAMQDDTDEDSQSPLSPPLKKMSLR